MARRGEKQPAKGSAYWKKYYQEHKAVRLALQRRYYAEHAEERRAYERKYNIVKKEHRRAYEYRKRYGLTLSQLDDMAKAQGGRCAICGEHPKPKSDGRGPFAVDHDHSTGAIRQLLCSDCNGGLGFFRDNPEVLMAAAHYIVRHGALALKRRAEEL